MAGSPLGNAQPTREFFQVIVVLVVAYHRNDLRPFLYGFEFIQQFEGLRQEFDLRDFARLDTRSNDKRPRAFFDDVFILECRKRRIVHTRQAGENENIAYTL